MAKIHVERGVVSLAAQPTRVGYDVAASGAGVIMLIEHEDLRVRILFDPAEAELAGASMLKLSGVAGVLASQKQVAVPSPGIVGGER